MLTDIQLIEAFTEKTETFEAYQSSMLIKRAVERQLGIIGGLAVGFQKRSGNKQKASRYKKYI